MIIEYKHPDDWIQEVQCNDQWVRKTVTGNSFEANLSTGLNIIRVDTDLECQGFVEKEVFISEIFISKPTNNDVKVHVGGEDKS